MDWIQTYTGRRFGVLLPDENAVDIADIAHALSLQCRFNGHCRDFYSVAEHSVRVSAILPAHLALSGLLHDAAEAYVSDLPRPVKRQLSAFGDLEDRVLCAIFQRYGLELPLDAAVHRADDVLLATEKRDLMNGEPEAWGPLPEPLPERIVPLPPGEAEQDFLERFRALVP